MYPLAAETPGAPDEHAQVGDGTAGRAKVMGEKSEAEKCFGVMVWDVYCGESSFFIHRGSGLCLCQRVLKAHMHTRFTLKMSKRSIQVERVF